MTYRQILTCLFFSLTAGSALAQSVDFIEPKDGDVLPGTFVAKFMVTGMKVAPAGEVIAGAGHHHLLINAANVDENVAIPFDSQHKHFGKGQTETSLDLTPGDYHLTLQFANGAHQSYGPEMSKTIRITVAKP